MSLLNGLITTHDGNIANLSSNSVSIHRSNSPAKHHHRKRRLESVPYRGLCQVLPPRHSSKNRKLEAGSHLGTMHAQSHLRPQGMRSHPLHPPHAQPLHEAIRPLAGIIRRHRLDCDADHNVLGMPPVHRLLGRAALQPPMRNFRDLRDSTSMVQYLLGHVDVDGPAAFDRQDDGVMEAEGGSRLHLQPWHLRYCRSILDQGLQPQRPVQPQVHAMVHPGGERRGLRVQPTSPLAAPERVVPMAEEPQDRRCPANASSWRGLRAERKGDKREIINGGRREEPGRTRRVACRDSSGHEKGHVSRVWRLDSRRGSGPTEAVAGDACEP